MRDLDKVLYVLNILKVIAIIYSILFIIALFISLYGIAKKEKLSYVKYLTPFYHLWYYFKLCRIPTWLLFIPVLDIVALIVSPFKLAYEYKYRSWFGMLGLFFPYVVLPMIAFGDHKCRRDLHKHEAIRLVDQIEQIDTKYKTDEDYDTYNMNAFKSNRYDEKNSIQEKIENIEKKASITEDFDDVIINDTVTNQKVVKEEVKDTPGTFNDDFELEETVKIFDKDIRVGIDAKEKEIEVQGSKKMEDTSNYQDYEKEKEKDVTIAFGGQNVVEKKAENVTEARVDLRKCPQCGAEVSPDMTYCPGCNNLLHFDEIKTDNV